MLDQVTLDRLNMVRQMIAEYNDEIERTRTRLESLRGDRKARQLAAQEATEQGQDAEARQYWQAAQELQHRIEDCEEQIDRLEQLRDVFRRKLLELQRAA